MPLPFANAMTTLERVPMTMGYFRLLLQRFGDTPERRAAILDGTGVGELDLLDPEADIALSQQIQQFDNLSRLLGEGWVFEADELTNHATHGALGIAALTATNLEAALKIAGRYAQVRSPFYHLRMRRTGQIVTIEYEPAVVLEPAQWRTIIEIAFSALTAVLATIAGKQLAGIRFCFPGEAPAHAELARARLGGTLKYDAPVTALELPVTYLKAQSPLADPALHARSVAALDLATHRTDDPLDLCGRVESLVAQLPPDQLGADGIALLLGLSHRTMARRLAASGTSFRILRDKELRRRAEALIKVGALSHAQIAERLGYADATSLSRSLRRWAAQRQRAHERQI